LAAASAIAFLPKRRPHFVAAGLFGFFFLPITYMLGAQRTLAATPASSPSAFRCW
jgi:hypothetical protein